MRRTSAFALALVVTSAPAIAEPNNRWWSGGSMGISEHGWSGSDGTSIYITCDSKRELSLRVTIRGIEPKPKTDVIFQVNGQTIKFWTTSDGGIEMKSRVSMNNLYFFFDELRSGQQMIMRFNGLSKSLSLMGSAKGLGQGLCK